MLRNFALYLFIGLMCASCAPEASNNYPKPDDLIPEDTYIDLLIEMQLAKAVYNSEAGISNTDSLVNVIYSKYDVSEDQYERSHSWYQSNYVEQQQRIEQAKERLLEERARIETPPDSTQSSAN